MPLNNLFILYRKPQVISFQLILYALKKFQTILDYLGFIFIVIWGSKLKIKKVMAFPKNIKV